MYRLSELLLELVSGSSVPDGLSEAEISEFKRNWHVEEVDEVFNEFHDAMLRLGPTDLPDYDGWIARFREAAVRIQH